MASAFGMVMVAGVMNITALTRRNPSPPLAVPIFATVLFGVTCNWLEEHGGVGDVLAMVFLLGSTLTNGVEVATAINNGLNPKDSAPTNKNSSAPAQKPTSGYA